MEIISGGRRGEVSDGTWEGEEDGGGWIKAVVQWVLGPPPVRTRDGGREVVQEYRMAGRGRGEERGAGEGHGAVGDIVYSPVDMDDPLPLSFSAHGFESSRTNLDSIARLNRQLESHSPGLCSSLPQARNIVRYSEVYPPSPPISNDQHDSSSPLSKYSSESSPRELGGGYHFVSQSPDDHPSHEGSIVDPDDLYEESSPPLHSPFLPPSPPLSPPPFTAGQSHGSSGSTQGSLVYVRMSDGRLVRKLSTIDSMGSEEGDYDGERRFGEEEEGEEEGESLYDEIEGEGEGEGWTTAEEERS